MNILLGIVITIISIFIIYKWIKVYNILQRLSISIDAAYADIQLVQQQKIDNRYMVDDIFEKYNNCENSLSSSFFRSAGMESFNIENILREKRSKYNSSVQDFNQYIKQFPINIEAFICRFTKKNYTSFPMQEFYLSRKETKGKVAIEN